MGKKVAVILSGCGFMDGAEIHEAVFTLLALDNAGAQVVCCAPAGNQAHVVDHLTGKPTDESRSILAESARIARGKVTDLAQIKAADFDAVFMPGGYGAAKNLCSYAFDGAEAKPHVEVARVLREFHAAAKPIGAVCIAPAVVASVFRGSGVKPVLTIGTDDASAGHIADMGSEHVSCQVKDFIVDKTNKIVSSPAYMLGKGPAEVYVGIEKAVRAVLELCG